MPYLEQMNYQSNRFFFAEGRVAGRDNPVKEKVTATGNISLAFILNVGYARIVDPEGKIDDDKGQRYSQNWHSIYCKIYAEKDRSNAWQVEEARKMIYREHVIVFGKIYESRATDPDGNEAPFLEYRVDSILFPERMASMLADGKTVDLSRIHAPEFVPGVAASGNSSAENRQIPEEGEEWF